MANLALQKLSLLTSTIVVGIKQGKECANGENIGILVEHRVGRL